MKQFVSFVRKEFYHIFRDPRTMAILLVMPVVLVVLFGFAITNEIRKAPFTVLDQSRDVVSERLVDRLAASEYFELYRLSESHEEVQTLFRQGKIRLAVVLPTGLASDPDAQVQLLADATDPNDATQLIGYATAILSATLSATVAGGAPRIVPVVQLLYNPQMKSAYMFVPGVMGLILILICALMTSVGIVREKEMGTMEVLLVSPLKPVYIILAKAVPYLLLSLVNIVTILLLSYYLLEVPIAGSVGLVLVLSVLYALVALCLGLFISTVVDTQQAAMLVSAVLLMLPVILLSGMVFPIENMPEVLQWISNVVPAKWYIRAIKDVMIKGLSVDAVWEEMGILLGMVLFLVAVSVKRFKIRL